MINIKNMLSLFTFTLLFSCNSVVIYKTEVGFECSNVKVINNDDLISIKEASSKPALTIYDSYCEYNTTQEILNLLNKQNELYEKCKNN